MLERKLKKSFVAYQPFSSDFSARMLSMLKGTGTHLVLINGENDPWSASSVTESPSETREIWTATVPGGAHGAGAGALVTNAEAPAAAAQKLYVKTLQRWAADR